MLNIQIGRRGSFLNTRMSHMKFRMNNTTVGTVPHAADFDIASIFARLKMYHGSNLLEQIHEYGLRVNMWHYMCGSTA